MMFHPQEPEKVCIIIICINQLIVICKSMIARGVHTLPQKNWQKSPKRSNFLPWSDPKMAFFFEGKGVRFHFGPFLGFSTSVRTLPKQILATDLIICDTDWPVPYVWMLANIFLAFTFLCFTIQAIKSQVTKQCSCNTGKKPFFFFSLLSFFFLYFFVFPFSLFSPWPKKSRVGQVTPIEQLFFVSFLWPYDKSCIAKHISKWSNFKAYGAFRVWNHPLQNTRLCS